MHNAAQVLYNHFCYVEVKILMILIPELLLNFIFVWSLDQIMTV